MIHALRANSLIQRKNQAQNATFDRFGNRLTDNEIANEIGSGSTKRDRVRWDLTCFFTRPFFPKQSSPHQPQQDSKTGHFRGCVPPTINSGIYDDYRSYYDRRNERFNLPALEAAVPTWDAFNRGRQGELAARNISSTNSEARLSSAISDTFRPYFCRSKPISIPFDFQSNIQFLLTLMPPLTVLAKLENHLMQNDNGRRRQAVAEETDQDDREEKVARTRIPTIHGGYRLVIPLRRSFRHLHMDLG